MPCAMSQYSQDGSLKVFVFITESCLLALVEQNIFIRVFTKEEGNSFLEEQLRC